MKEETEDLGAALQEKFGLEVTVKFVDVFSPEMSSFAEINALLQSGRVQMPLVVINGEPRFHGGISLSRISKAVEQVVHE